MLLDDVVEKAVIKTIVRDRTEAMFQEEGALRNLDYDVATDHPFIDNPEKRKVGMDYYFLLSEKSHPVTQLLKEESPEEIYEGNFFKKPKDDIKIVTRPYGIHLKLSERDLKATEDRLETETVLGVADPHPYEGVLISRGPVCKVSEDLYMRTILFNLNENPVRKKQFQKKFNIPIDEALERYERIEDTTLGFRLLPSWEQEALRQEHEDVKAFLRGGHAKMKVREEIKIVRHELEHLHSFCNGLKDFTLNEVVSYAIPVELSSKKSVTKKDAKIFKVIYEHGMKENFNAFLGILKYLREHGHSVLETGFQKRVLPMALAEVGSVGGVYKELPKLLHIIQEVTFQK